MNYGYMAIRIRKVDGLTIALCAAETDEKPGDIYLDDNAHHALTTKFGMDFESEGLIGDSLADKALVKAMAGEKRIGVPLTLEEAQTTGLCRLCRTDAHGNLPLVLNYGKEFAHASCLSRMLDDLGERNA